jgi:hypothetical protein
MYPSRRTHWNKIGWGQEFIIEDDNPDGQKLRLDGYLNEIQPPNKADARIKRIAVKLKLKAKD